MEIRFTENEFSGLLDREKAVADAKRAYSDQLALLRDLVNYGTNLIPRCYTSSDKGLTDLVVIGTLLRQIVAMLDAIELLMSNGAVYAASLQARALFEASVYIEWIISSDADKKAKYYYVSSLRGQRRSAQLIQPGTPEATEFEKQVSDFPSLRDPKAIEDAKNAIQEIDRVLSQPAFAAVNKDFDNSRKAKRGEPKWYAPLGVSSVRAMVNAVGRPEEYTVFYSIWS